MQSDITSSNKPQLWPSISEQNGGQGCAVSTPAIQMRSLFGRATQWNRTKGWTPPCTDTCVFVCVLHCLHWARSVITACVSFPACNANQPWERRGQVHLTPSAKANIPGAGAGSRGDATAQQGMQLLFCLLQRQRGKRCYYWVVIIKLHVATLKTHAAKCFRSRSIVVTKCLTVICWS